MQHNKDKDDWTVYTKPTASFCNPVEVIRFKSGQYVTLEFFVPFDDQVVIHAAGLNENGVLKCRTCSINRFGLRWNDSGIGIHLKRVTSIAQPVKYTPGTGAFLHNVHWKEVKIGKYQGSVHLWGQSDTGNNCVYPDTAKVYVDFRSFSEEFVHIGPI